MINQRTNQGQTIIKLLNYDIYNSPQTTGKPSNKPKANQGQTTDKPKANQNKEYKEYKEDILNPPLPALTAGGDEIGLIRSIFLNLEVPDNAKEAHQFVVNILENNGFVCKTEYFVADRGDGCRGRIDIFAEKDGYACAIEIDHLTPRDKSIFKLKQVNATRIILTRGGENEMVVEGIDMILPVKIQRPENTEPWREDFQVYLKGLREAYRAIVEDAEYMAERAKYHPGLDIKLSIEKACIDFWAKPKGWKHKKKSKSVNLDWKETLTNALDIKCNRVWIQKTNETNETGENETGEIRYFN
jgi:hypothetical protein